MPTCAHMPTCIHMTVGTTSLTTPQLKLNGRGPCEPCEPCEPPIIIVYLETLYKSMPRRIQAVVEAQGGHTKY